MNIIVAGEKKSGKSSSLFRLAERLKAAGIGVGGVISRHIFRDGRGAGYEAVNPDTGEVLVLAELPEGAGDHEHHKDDEHHVITEGGDTFNYCHYVFYKDSFVRGNGWIRDGLERDVLFLDEVGNIEMSHNKGWDFEVPFGAKSAGKKPVLIYGIRDDFVGKFRARNGLDWEVFLVKNGDDLDEDADKLFAMVKRCLGENYEKC